MARISIGPKRRATARARAADGACRPWTSYRVATSRGIQCCVGLDRLVGKGSAKSLRSPVSLDRFSGATSPTVPLGLGASASSMALGTPVLREPRTTIGLSVSGGPVSPVKQGNTGQRRIDFPAIRVSVELISLLTASAWSVLPGSPMPSGPDSVNRMRYCRAVRYGGGAVPRRYGDRSGEKMCRDTNGVAILKGRS